jgi:ATP-dependent exoDNAse (exonuclease V) alpha subunit
VALGDERQVPSVDSGGLFSVFIDRLGAVELKGNHRFADERQREAAERLRAADPKEVEQAVAQYEELGLLHTFDRVGQMHQAMVSDWLGHIEAGQTAKMVADSNRAVDDLNIRARDALVKQGKVARKGQRYTDELTGRRIILAEGDRVRLGRNDAQLRQPNGPPVMVRNGMEGTVTRASRRGVEVELEAEHVSRNGPERITLPAGYVGADVDYGYASTVDKAQGSTVDHVLYHPTDRSSSEGAYVALSRGRQSNRIYAVKSTAWEEALAGSRAHTLAADQQPGRVEETAREQARASSRDAARQRAGQLDRREDGREEGGRAMAM